MNTVFIIGIFLSFFLSILILAKPKKSLPDMLLAVWLGIIAIHLTSYYLYSLDYWTQYPHLIGVTLPVPLLHGPMLFLYTLYSLRPESKLRKADYLHFVPAALTWLYMSPFYFFYSAEQKRMVDQGLVDDSAVFSIIILVAFIISGLIYPVLAYRLIEKHDRVIDDNFSFNDNVSLGWLKYCIYGTGLVYLLVAIIYFLKQGIGYEFGFDADLIFYGLVVFFVICIGYFGIRHQSIFNDDLSGESDQLVFSRSEGEYKKSGLKPEVADKIHLALRDIMEREKPHKDPKLTLSTLARSLDVSTNHLSQVINQYENVNFHDFVNRYRIETFIENASTNQSFSILAHAYDAGFNSKSSFNGVFKKHKGTTPSKFLETLNA